jgi:hypothetical protein
MNNLVDLVAMASSESPALRRRLDELERELAALNGRIEEARHGREAAGTVPDDG